MKWRPLLLVLGCAAGSVGRHNGLIEPSANAELKTNMPIAKAAHAHTNRLAREKSPYLLQHQFNPVDWFPWGDEAFAKARSENKPIFLSVGYSTCHWCHVMERESFENEKLAEFLNKNFVSIKVDREERPDVDKIYMTFVQASTGQGGWPMSVFLTPDRKPFFGGTYFPPTNQHGRPGFLQILERLHQLWETRQQDLTESAKEIHTRLQAAAAQTNSGTTAELTADVIKRAGELFKTAFDPRYGGFGGAPKFPQPSQPRFLLRYGRRFKDDEAIRMVLRTCDHMAAGGIHDQLGGGFARYSVDAEWLVPHFEKMLYDNAQLVELYLDAYLISGEPKYAGVTRDTLTYVLRDMTLPGGGFYSAEDADSEGHEGKYYCWTRAELSGLLTPDEFKVVIRYFGITEKGNFLDHSHPEPLRGLNVLSVVDPALSASDARLLASAKQKMFDTRAKRIRPHLDDKILASWNGLMLGAMARASVVLADDAYRAAAEKNLAFLREKLWNAKSGTLSHRWRDGETDQVQLLVSYAFLLHGVLELYEATLQPQHLDFAIELGQSMLARFYDSEHGGFWQSSSDAKDLILRVKEEYDGAEPSGNSVAVLSLLRLGRITERKEFIEAAEKSLQAGGHRLQKTPQAVTCLLQALDLSLDEPGRAVVAGEPARPDLQNLLKAVHSVYQPNKLVLGNKGAVEPFARTLEATNGALVYLCTGTACQPPTNDPAKIRSMLAAR